MLTSDPEDRGDTSFETPVHMPITGRYIPGDDDIRNYGCENLRSYTVYTTFIETIKIENWRLLLSRCLVPPTSLIYAT
jgi:hypothetical protein